MKVSRKLFVTSATISLLILLSVPNLAALQGLKSLLASAKGKGTLTVGKEVFKVTAVVVKLNEDGTGEVTLVTDLQLFVACTWTSPDDLSKGIELKFTGGADAASVEGAGKLFLKPDGKSVASLSMQGVTSTVKRKIQLDFVAE